jgi:hypothetical protein
MTAPVRVGVGATSNSSSIVPWLVLGGVLVAGVAVLAVGAAGHARTVDDEANDLFPPPYGRDPTPGQRALTYRAAVGRCYYSELRQEHSPEDAERITKAALRRDRGWLAGLARRGATVSAGCSHLKAGKPATFAP